ncbi:hypothetical protein FOA52_011772 [Chlamydomonas sp. UWO 241]|nr:hypothetical protein FOA52_011772 [Chlamydomonas sp. UWO 241]
MLARQRSAGPAVALLVLAWGAMLVRSASAKRTLSAEEGCWYYKHVLDSAESAPRSTPVLSSINVDDAFDVRDVRVADLSLTATKLGPLKITLSASSPTASESDPPKTIVLKDTRTGGVASTLSGVSFDDAAIDAMPANDKATMATVTGAYYPQQDLLNLATGSGKEASRGGSNGVWTLRVVDLATGREERQVGLESWTLVLCPAAPGATGAVEVELSPPVKPATPAVAVGSEGVPAAPVSLVPNTTADTAIVANARAEAEDNSRTTALLAQASPTNCNFM